MFVVVGHRHIGQFVSEIWNIIGLFRCKLSHFQLVLNPRNPFVHRDVAVQHLVT